MLTNEIQTAANKEFKIQITQGHGLKTNDKTIKGKNINTALKKYLTLLI